jgi:hypothetical protein
MEGSLRENPLIMTGYWKTMAYPVGFVNEALAKEFTLFHFSPRYRHREQELRDEALAAFAG